MSAPPKEGEVLRRRLEIKNRFGLHARAAAQLIETARVFAARITINDEVVDRTNMLGLMMLAAAQGTTIDVAAHGPDAREALAAIEALIEGRFNEDE